MTQPDHRPRFHFTAPQNWINDPNGVCFHEGRYHLYYQYNPNAAKWGDIHWGHASSADLVSWRDEPMALAPSPGPDAGGCFSGSFAVVNGVPTVYYTGYTTTRQVQCVATSSDLTHWTKHPDRTLVEPPPDVEANDFRDPYVFQHGGHWYMALGASLNHQRGQCLLYRSDDGITWEDRGVLFAAEDSRLGVMWECPNFFPLGDKWVLTVSLWPGLGVHAFVGRFENERFVSEWNAPLDVDAGAFAHLTTRVPDGRTLQWAWANEQREQPLIDADGWAGCMTVPRQLGLDAQGGLTQAPVAEVASLRQTPLALRALPSVAGTPAQRWRFTGRHLDIEARFAAPGRHKVGLTLLANPTGSECTRIVYWPEAQRLSIERGRSSLAHGVKRQDVHAHLVLQPGEALALRVLLDASMLEVFANDRVCLTTRIYPTDPDSELGEVFSEGPDAVDCCAWVMGSMWPEGVVRGTDRPLQVT
jgi:beta-fructofuranosidase